MTRFARAEGSKSCNKKVPEEGTPWSQLKSGMLQSGVDGKASTEIESEFTNETKDYNIFSTKSNSWSVIDEDDSSKVNDARGQKRSLEQRKSGSSNKRLMLFHNRSTSWKIDNDKTEEINYFKNSLNESKSIAKESSNEICKTSKHTKIRKDGKKCFQCMQVGHVMAFCPQRKELDICFICGSSEHKVKQCKQRKPGQTDYKYATCFICKVEGHISSFCPDNTSGLYPNGGACRKCGEVTHFARDCPKLMKKTSKSHTTVSRITDDVEGLPEDSISIKVVNKNKLLY